jgi:hypothetical protein
LPIIRITKEQVQKANKARKAALLKNPDYRLHDERQQLLRQAAFQQKIETERADAAAPDVSDANDPDHRPCDEGPRVKREGGARKKERDS